MTIAFPTNEERGLQANMGEACKNAAFFTVVNVNEKGGITSVVSVSCKNIKEMQIDYLVLPRKDSTTLCANVFIDEESPNVDTALVKILREKLFKKSA